MIPGKSPHKLSIGFFQVKPFVINYPPGCSTIELRSTFSSTKHETTHRSRSLLRTVQRSVQNSFTVQRNSPFTIHRLVSTFIDISAARNHNLETPLSLCRSQLDNAITVPFGSNPFLACLLELHLQNNATCLGAMTC